MKGITRTVIAMLAVTALVGVAGGWLGVRYGLQQARASTSLDMLLHRDLDLSVDQQRRLAAMEARFNARRAILENQMRAANSELAAAILMEHRYGPAAEQAIEHFHEAMKTLQEETLQHVLAMRAVLTPQQAQQFDRIIARALDSDQT